MYNHKSNYLSPKFKAKIKQAIKEMRPTFVNEMDGHGEIYFGHRFNDDDQCFQGFVNCLPGKHVNKESELREWGVNIEHALELNHGVYRQAVWNGLKNAAETDWHYQFEKSWD